MSYLNIRGIGIFGDASDGDVTISSNSILSRDMFYNNLTVTVGFSLETHDFRIFVKHVLLNNGTIKQDGNSATTFTGAVAAPILTATTTIFALSGAGGTGNTGAGSGGGASTALIGGGGGTGGAGSSGAGGASGALGSISSSNGGNGTTSPGLFKALPYAFIGTIVNAYTKLTPGAGGGGGGGDGTNRGGGGGSGAGVVWCAARNILGTGAFQAVGGNGANASAGNCGGGACGGGGAIILYSQNNTTVDAPSLTFPRTQGTNGTGIGTGTAATGGSAGSLTRIVWGL